MGGASLCISFFLFTPYYETTAYLPVFPWASMPVAYLFFLLLLLLHLILVLDDDKFLFITVSSPPLLPSFEYAQVWSTVCKVGVELIWAAEGKNELLQSGAFFKGKIYNQIY